MYLQFWISPVGYLCKAACNVSPSLLALALTPLLPTSPPVPASSPLNLLPPTSSGHCGCQLGCCHPPICMDSLRRQSSPPHSTHSLDTAHDTWHVIRHVTRSPLTSESGDKLGGGGLANTWRSRDPQQSPYNTSGSGTLVLWDNVMFPPWYSGWSLYGQDGHPTGSVNSGIFAEGMVSVRILEFGIIDII